MRVRSGPHRHRSAEALNVQICNYMDVRPLANGRSSDASKNSFDRYIFTRITLHVGPIVDEPKFKLIPCSAAVQYLTDTGPIPFDRGTGGGDCI